MVLIRPKVLKSEYSAMFRLIKEFAPYRLAISAILFLGLIISAVQPFCLKFSQRIIDELQKGGSAPFFRWVPLILSLVFLVNGLAKYFHNAIRRYVTEKLIIKLRTDLFRKYLALPLSVTDQKRTGDLLSGIQNDLVQVNQGVDTLCDIFKEPFIFLGLIGVALYWDWKLTLITLVAAPLVGLLFSKSGAAVKRYSRRNLEQFSDLVSLGQESLSGARIVKVFRLENALMEKFRQVHDAYFKTIWKSIKVQELATPSVEFIGAVLMGGVILYGRYQISHGWLTTGELVAFMFALGLIQMPIKQLNNAWLKMKNAEAAAERIFQTLDTPNPLEDRPGHIAVKEFNSEIRFEHVSLCYGEKRALSDISFVVKRGQCVALVGPSGSGKTSLINLIPRLYEVSEGRITLDSIDIRDIVCNDLRDLISFVTQDIFLFNDSIYENIRFGRPGASPEEIREAARLAHCLDFIENSPEGFQSKIGDRGVCLSGGERQRIAIARAFLKGSPILVLDEATSSLDSNSEATVQEALDTLMLGKTAFIVAHRFSTIKRADKIFVLENGVIREQGMHRELVEQEGLYSRLFELQTHPTM
jgi:ATP-binding cassette, subfamily B, bacterial MsbA